MAQVAGKKQHASFNIFMKMNDSELQHKLSMAAGLEDGIMIWCSRGKDISQRISRCSASRAGRFANGDWSRWDVFHVEGMEINCRYGSV